MASKKQEGYPKLIKVICRVCNDEFDFVIKRPSSHVNKYCSPKCREIGRVRKHKESMCLLEKAQDFKDFDRVSVCMRDLLTCEYYSECQASRTFQQDLGSRYKSALRTKKPCFVARRTRTEAFNDRMMALICKR